MHFNFFAFPRSVIGTFAALALGSSFIVTPTIGMAGDNTLRNLAIGAGLAAIAGKISRNSRTKNTTSRKTTKKRASKKKPSGPVATIGTFKTTRSEVMDYQTQLNTLGFDTGTPDGSVGKNTRAGVMAYQASLGNEQTGRLTDVEAARLKILTDDPNAPSVQMAQTPTPGVTNPLPTAKPDAGVQVMTNAIPLPPSMQSATAAPKMALIAPNGGSAVTLDVFSIDSDNSDFDLASKSGNFDILQVRTGDALDAAFATLADEGVSNCQTMMEVSLCSMEGNPNDNIAIRATTDSLGTARITTIARHMKFDPPYPESILTSMLEENYGDLVSAPDRMMGSAGCEAVVGPTTHTGERIFEASVSSAQDELTELAAGCETFARLSMDGPEQGQISNLFIVLFDGARISAKTDKPTGLAKIKF